MEKLSSSSELFSHPGKLLEEHLVNVSKLCINFLKEKPIEIQQKLEKIIKVIGLAHDLGKATETFQEYLKKEKVQTTQKPRHSLFSALCTYYLVKETKPADELYPFFAYVVVRRHHDDLIDVKDEISLIDEREQDNLFNQLKDINPIKFQTLINNLMPYGLPIEINIQTIERWIKDFKNELKSYKRLLRHSSRIENYLTLNLLFSLLLDADKSDAVIGSESVPQRPDLEDENLVKNYLLQLKPTKNSINELRQKAFHEVDSASIPGNQRIFSINLPTGLGKTLTGLSFALKLRNMPTHKKPRIVYSLPYLSIIDQSAKVFEEVLLKNNITPTSDILLEHHHLSEIFYKTREEQYEGNEAEILIEGWNSEIVLTTFVQLFHTLLSNKNSSLRKFHRLANSIIILDEVQAIPTKYWKLIDFILNATTHMLDTKIIVMTATDPLIFGDSPTPLIQSKKYQRSLNRVILKPELNPITLEQLNHETLPLIEKGNTILYVFNTISSAKKFYTLLESLEVPKTYLSTHIVSKERLRRINEIKQRKYQIVVSTQLVEAGVDIDFDIVIRDIAPFDSIVQSAGRCNRNCQGKLGKVIVKKIVDDNNRAYSNRIYDPVLIDISESLLRDKAELTEQEIYELICEYYNRCKKYIDQTESKEILEAVLQLRYDSEVPNEISISSFKLIEEDYPKIDVFVETDEDAENVWKEFDKVKNIKDFFERRKEFLKIRRNFYDYVISVPASTQNLPPLINGIYYVPRSQLADFYDHETGYKMNQETLIW